MSHHSYDFHTDNWRTGCGSRTQVCGFATARRGFLLLLFVSLTATLSAPVATAQRHGGGRGIAGGNRMSIGSTWQRNYGGNSRSSAGYYGQNFGNSVNYRSPSVGYPVQYRGNHYGHGYRGYGYSGPGYYGSFYPLFNTVTVTSARFGTSYTAPLLLPFDPYFGYGLSNFGYGYNPFGYGYSVYGNLGYGGYGYGGNTIVSPPVVVAPNMNANLPVVVPGLQEDIVPPADAPPILNLPNPFGERKPLVDEFAMAAVPQPAGDDVGAVEQIQSLRRQSAGDDVFRRGDYVAAEASYRAAVQAAPLRRAPWLRLTWSLVAQQRLAEAAATLKRALLLPDDPTSSWIRGEELYGDQADAVINSHSDVIWDWLHERPGSSDRLLLLAAFQNLRGYSGMAAELLESAAEVGLPPEYEDAFGPLLQEQAADAAPRRRLHGQRQGQRGADQERPLFDDVHLTDLDAPAPPAPAPPAPGIHMQGRTSIESPTTNAEDSIESNDDSDFSLTIPNE